MSLYFEKFVRFMFLAMMKCGNMLISYRLLRGANGFPSLFKDAVSNQPNLTNTVETLLLF